jgi:catechol 2,3-dioxygenase-like lactoylglutathione lyase family enzyme
VRPRLTLSGVVLDAPDANELAAFYRRLLGWDLEQDEPGWVKLRAPGGGAGLSFQTEERYARPTWPAGPGDQQMQVHLDIAVEDLDVASAYTVAAGATRGAAPAAGRRAGPPRPGRPSLLPVPDRLTAA